MSELNSTAAALMAEWPAGTHLASPRRGYTHHGIYVGAGRVVHYAGLSGARAARALRYGPVEEVSVDEFAQGHAVELIPEPYARFRGEDVVQRARSRLGENRYKLLSNNCEHFCSWCLDDEHRSVQVDRFLRARAAERAARVRDPKVALA